MDPKKLENLKQKLLKKGWSEQEIKEVVMKLHSSDKINKHIHYRVQANKIVYWTSLLVLTICNFVISIFLIPFLIVLTSWIIYPLLIIIGLIFGFFYNLIITDIEYLEKKHHLTALILVPVISIINIFIITHIANKICFFLSLPTKHNPLLMALVYTVFFVGPFFFLTFLKTEL